MDKLLILFLAFLALSSCGKVRRERMLQGDWQAVRVMEGDSILPVPDSVIWLHFYENYTYRYEGTLKYEEAGHWRVKNHLLLVRDTLQAEPEERRMRIQKLTEDSLFLEMMDGGRKRLLVMGKR